MNLRYKVIGVSGKIGSGKDFITDFLSSKIAERFNVLPDHRKFAEKVKLVTAVLTDKPEKTMYTQKGKQEFIESFNQTVGELQQIVGTEIFRAYDPDFWIKATFTDYESGQCVIVSDVRFKNEADYILDKLHGIIIRIEGDPLHIRKNSKRDMTHASECDLDEYDRFTLVHNNVMGEHNLEALWANLMDLPD